eukprot:5340633-Amphidinium_carterae.1
MGSLVSGCVMPCRPERFWYLSSEGLPLRTRGKKVITECVLQTHSEGLLGSFSVRHGFGTNPCGDVDFGSWGVSTDNLRALDHRGYRLN